MVNNYKYMDEIMRYFTLLAKSDSLKHFITIKSILFSLLYFKLFNDNKNILNKHIFHSLQINMINLFA